MNLAEQIPSRLYFSKYSHKIEKNGVFAYLHALRMKPVYLNPDMESAVEVVRSSAEVHKFLESITDAA